MSDVSGVGDVTTPPLEDAAKKTRPHASVGSGSDDGNGSGTAAKTDSRRSTERAKAATYTNGDETGDSDDDDEGGEEYEVENITEHTVDKHGVPLFHVKWKGYDDPEDYTWEPEENLSENASEILGDYIFKIGGPEKLLEKPSKGKKRGRTSTSATASAPTKRSRKGNEHPADRESPSEAPKTFKPPAGSWEDEVVDVEMFRDERSRLRVCLTWKCGGKSQHSAQQAYVRCPQRILRFYESHISFKTVS